MCWLTVVLLVFAACGSASAQTYTISTFAGNVPLPVNIKGTSAGLYGLNGIAADRAGNLFFADGNDVLRLDAITGILTLVAGNGSCCYSGDDGLATNAQLYPDGVAVDSAGNVYIADLFNNRVRNVSNGVITTIAGNGTPGFSGDNGPATSAQLYTPTGVAVDSAGNIFIADRDNNRIRRVTNGVITTVAGNGTPGFSDDNGAATSAQLHSPYGVAVDSAGNLYVADSLNKSIRRIANGVITTVFSNGRFGGFVYSVVTDSAGNVYIPDPQNHRILKVANGVITTVAGNGTAGFSGDNGPAISAELDAPAGIAVDSAGNLYIADSGNRRIRKVSNGVITTLAGNGGACCYSGDNGPAISGQLNDPRGIAVDFAGNVYIADILNNRIRKVSNGVITTVAGNGTAGFSGDNGPAISAQLNNPFAVAVDSAGNLYIADTNNFRIRKVSNGVITTVAGNGTFGFSGDNGPATSARLSAPYGVTLDSGGNLYIAEDANVRKVSNGMITTVAGNGVQGFSGDGGPATSAQLNGPSGLAVDSAGNLYIADTNNFRIRNVSNGVITTVAGNGTQGFSGDNGPATSAQIFPFGVAVDSAGNLFIADRDNHRIRKLSNGIITTVAGSGTQGLSGDNGPAISAELNYPESVAVDSAGNVYIADFSNNRIRLLTPGTAPSITPNGIVPVYSTIPVIQPGSWVSLYGANLASTTTLWNNDFPTSLGGTTVTIDNKPAYLWVVSPTQINLQVPDDSTTGPVSVVVTTPSGTATSTVTLAPQAPSFSLLGDNKHVAAEIATPNGAYDLLGPANTFSFSTRPVKPGETLTLFGVGFGPTTPAVPAGKVFSGSAPTKTPVTVTIGGINAPVAYSGITQAGLYQINLTVPSAPSGDQPVVATINGVQTPPGPVVTVQ